MSAGLSKGLTTRSPLLGDVEAMYDLSRAYELSLFGEVEVTLEDMRIWLASPTVNLAEDALLVFDSTERLVGWLFLEQIQYVKYFVMIRVLADYADTDVPEYLLHVAEEKARGLLGRAEPGVRAVLSSRAFTAELVRRDLLQRAGLTEVRRSWRMERELAEAPPEPRWPEGVELRPFVPERDGRQVFEVIDAAFRDHWGHIDQPFEEWKYWSMEHRQFDPSLWFIAYADEQVVGGSLCIDQGIGIGWIDVLGIQRSWRGKGLGLALLYHSFGEFYRRGNHRVSLYVDSQNLTGATRLYHRAGMHIARESIAYEKELRAGIEPSVRVLGV